MKIRTWIALAALVLLVLGTTVPAHAAVGDTTVHTTVPVAVQLTVPSDVTVPFNVAGLGTADLAVNLATNCPWHLTVQKGGDLASGPNSIPSSELMYWSQVSTVGNPVPQISEVQFAIGGSDVVTGGQPTGLAGSDVTVHYDLYGTFDDVTGPYTAIHTYTLTAE